MKFIIQPCSLVFSLTYKFKDIKDINDLIFTNNSINNTKLHILYQLQLTKLHTNFKIKNTFTNNFKFEIYVGNV